MNNKKVFGISVAAVFILVVAIVATSFAVFSANFTGTQNNTLQTGYVTLNCNETLMSLSDVSAMTDAQGIAATNNAATCTLTSTMNGTMTVGYDIALTDVDTGSTSDALTTENVKMQLSKVVGSGQTEYLGGSDANNGVFVKSLADNGGSHDANLTSYVFDSATLTGNKTVVYTIKTWVSSIAAGTNTPSSSTTASCSDSTYTEQTACETAGEIWGTSQTQTQAGGEFKFKLKIGATQVL